MPRYDFSRLSVLVAEDSKFMQSIFTNVLKALGVQRVTVAADGEEAIGILTPIRNANSQLKVLSSFDVVISDYFMPRLDGGTLLLWIRRANLSPDRFLPVIMVSAAADQDVLFKCRDAGVSEFLAKPFSAEMVAQRLVTAVERPRQFIYCTTYFGPTAAARRGRSSGIFAKPRPMTSRPSTPGKALGPTLRTSKKKVWHFRLPNRLQKKLSAGMSDRSERTAFQPELLSQAEGMIANMETDYADWVSDLVKKLRNALNRAVEVPEGADGHLRKINAIALELRGQGSMFGYPLMTQFGKSLYEFTVTDTIVTPQLAGPDQGAYRPDQCRHSPAHEGRRRRCGPRPAQEPGQGEEEIRRAPARSRDRGRRGPEGAPGLRRLELTVVRLSQSGIGLGRTTNHAAARRFVTRRYAPLLEP